MKIREAEKHLQDGILSIYSESESANIAKLIMEQLTGHSRSYLLLNRQELLTSEQTEILRRYVVRLQQHEPVQYILNKSWFYDMELYVDKNVLIPRPETEELVHWIVNDIESSGLDVFGHNPSEADRTRQLKYWISEPGSGCIALALKKTMPKAEVWGCDYSEEALNVARRNGADRTSGLTSRESISWMRSSRKCCLRLM
jgi:release factor glutamine methyltransferase